MANIKIRISDLTHEFDHIAVFDSLNYSFDGSKLAVVGPNGSGKSTLLKLLAGLLTPSYGEIAIIIDDYKLGRQELRNYTGLSAPDVVLYNELSVIENLFFLLQARAMKASSKLINDALDKVGLSERAYDLVGELSSGLRHRASIAAAIAHNPKILMLDEPHSFLDDKGRAMVESLINEYSKQGMVILATNDHNEASNMNEILDLTAN